MFSVYFSLKLSNVKVNWHILGRFTFLWTKYILWVCCDHLISKPHQLWALYNSSSTVLPKAEIMLSWDVPIAESTKKQILWNHATTARCQGSLRVICIGQWRLHNCPCAIFKPLSWVRPLALISHYNVLRYILKVINCHGPSDIISYLKLWRLRVSPSAHIDSAV